MTTPQRSPGRNRPPTVQCTLTYEDYWNFNKYAFLRTPWLSVYLGALFAGALALMVFDAQRQSDPGTAFLRNFLVSGAIIIFLAAAVYFRSRGNARKIFARNPQLAERTTVTLDDRGAHVQNPAGALDVEWRMFKRIEQTRDSIYLFYGLGLATIVPKRAFRTEADAQAFFAFARESWARATESARP